MRESDLCDLCSITLHLISDIKKLGWAGWETSFLIWDRRWSTLSSSSQWNTTPFNLLNSGLTSSHLIHRLKLLLYLKLTRFSVWNPTSSIWLNPTLTTAGLPEDSLHTGICIILWNWTFLEGRTELVFLHRIISSVCSWCVSCVGSEVLHERLCKSSSFLSSISRIVGLGYETSHHNSLIMYQ